MKRSLENPNAAFVTMSVSPVLSLMRFFGSIFREYEIILSLYRRMNTPHYLNYLMGGVLIRENQSLSIVPSTPGY